MAGGSATYVDCRSFLYKGGSDSNGALPLWLELRRGASRKDLRFAQIPHNAPIRVAMRPGWMRTLSRPWPQNRSLYRSRQQRQTRRRQPGCTPQPVCRNPAEKPRNKYQQDAPGYKTCKFTAEAIVADGTEKGELRKLWIDLHNFRYAQFPIMCSAAMIWPLGPAFMDVGDIGHCA
jgi:hypothetical protein